MRFQRVPPRREKKRAMILKDEKLLKILDI
jgi:hypothetical protein